MSTDIDCLCIYGIELDREDLLKTIDVKIENADELHDTELFSLIHDQLKTPLIFNYIPDRECFYIGRSYDDMHNRSTLDYSKWIVLKEIKRLTKHGFKQQVKCQHICIAFEE